MSRPLAWITGAGGLIGHYLVQTAPRFAAAWRVRGLTRSEVDLQDFDAVRREFGLDTPRLIIHCAALSKTQDCEKDPALARKLNVDVTRSLAGLAANIPFIFFSSDLVFDGRRGGYDESAAVNPLGVYAETKIAAEHIVLTNPKHSVVRTSLNGGISPTGDRGFNEQLRRAFREGKQMTLFTDEFRSPIPAAATAQAVWELAAQNRPGLYHLAGSERLSRWQIGQLFAARWPELKPNIQPESLATYRGAPRSPDTTLNCAKIQKLLSFPLPHLSEWLKANPGDVF
jgi:dTDP-4-dehydrorhamnose reductase